MIKDAFDFTPIVDVAEQTYANPHFRHGCDVKFEVANSGLVYCGDCASQIGFVPLEFAGLQVGGNGKASRWLQAENVRKAWMDAVDVKEKGGRYVKS